MLAPGGGFGTNGRRYNGTYRVFLQRNGSPKVTAEDLAMFGDALEPRSSGSFLPGHTMVYVVKGQLGRMSDVLVVNQYGGQSDHARLFFIDRGLLVPIWFTEPHRKPDISLLMASGSKMERKGRVFVTWHYDPSAEIGPYRTQQWAFDPARRAFELVKQTAGDRPLTCAMQASYIPLLLRYGADINAKDSHGKTILTRVKNEQRLFGGGAPDEVVEALRKNGAHE